MLVRIMVYFLFICSLYQNSLSQQRNLNYSIQGLHHKINRNNLINDKDKIVNSQRNSSTQVFIERPPWWLNLKQNRNDSTQAATGIPSVKEIELFGRRDARRGRSYYAESTSNAPQKNKMIFPIIFHFNFLQLILGCLPSLSWLSNVKLFI